MEKIHNKIYPKKETFLVTKYLRFLKINLDLFESETFWHQRANKGGFPNELIEESC